MGQKTNPIGFRLGVIKSWESRWFSEKDYAKLLQEDITIRKFLIKKLSSAGISKVVIERPAKLAKITIHTSRPGVIIGKKGSDIENLTKKQIAAFQSKNTSKALTIIYSLQVSLDFDKSPEIAQNLFQIYEYCRVQIINSLLKKTKTGLVKAIEVLNDILEGWSNMSPRKENV